MNYLEIIGDLNEEAVVLEGLDDAVVGIVERAGSGAILLYSLTKVISIFMGDGMTYEEALEYYDYHGLGAPLGDGTPVFLLDNLEDYGI